MMDVDAINAAFPKYPMTVHDKGWVYGVWYCGTSFTKQPFYGAYPPTFLKRALALFPTAISILHAPSGTLTGVPGITLDSVAGKGRKSDVIADCGSLPFPDQTFDLVLSDPPYSKADSVKYGCAPFPMRKFMAESHRVLKPGGALGVTRYPSYRRKEFALKGLIAVVTGFERATRMFSVFQKAGPLLPPTPRQPRQKDLLDYLAGQSA